MTKSNLTFNKLNVLGECKSSDTRDLKPWLMWWKCYVIPAPENAKGVCKIPSELPGADYSTELGSDPACCVSLHLIR